eukprot:GHVU01084592.1.p2 GENE.GHVU01084592.1~~GHVU01084592.1.p2  ORF type:complete len:130 (+),score=0.80 GHVU01084592.1:3-392(+)
MVDGEPGTPLPTVAPKARPRRTAPHTSVAGIRLGVSPVERGSTSANTAARINDERQITRIGRHTTDIWALCMQPDTPHSLEWIRIPRASPHYTPPPTSVHTPICTRVLSRIYKVALQRSADNLHCRCAT